MDTNTEPASPAPAADQAVALLRALGAEGMAHPGGTLLAHLRRVQARLAVWRARPALQLAGLCHAFYGTDGFPTGLLPVDRRTDLAAVIGAEAEAIVYLYASCDRKATCRSWKRVKRARRSGPHRSRKAGSTRARSSSFAADSSAKSRRSCGSGTTVLAATGR